MTFQRITVSTHPIDGAPGVCGLGMARATVVSMAADGMTPEEILRAYPDLEPDDIRESLQYAAETVRECGLPPLRASCRPG
jgi:uncharacterized protein (DUF433 family)